MRNRQAGAEKDGGLDIGGKTTSPSVACLHQGLPVDHFSGVMAGLVPAIHVLLTSGLEKRRGAHSVIEIGGQVVMKGRCSDDLNISHPP